MKLLRNIILISFIFFLFSSLVRNLFDYKNKLIFYEQYKKTYEEEKRKNLTLKTELLKKTSQKEIEKTIRNKLNLLKSDETAILLPSPTPTATPPTPPSFPVWQQWWKMFFK